MTSAREEAEKTMDLIYPVDVQWRALQLDRDLRDAIEAALLAERRRGEDSMRERAVALVEREAEIFAEWVEPTRWNTQKTGKYIAAAIRALPGDAT